MLGYRPLKVLDIIISLQVVQWWFGLVVRAGERERKTKCNGKDKDTQILFSFLPKMEKVRRHYCMESVGKVAEQRALPRQEVRAEEKRMKRKSFLHYHEMNVISLLNIFFRSSTYT